MVVFLVYIVHPCPAHDVIEAFNEFVRPLSEFALICLKAPNFVVGAVLLINAPLCVHTCGTLVTRLKFVAFHEKCRSLLPGTVPENVGKSCPVVDCCANQLLFRLQYQFDQPKVKARLVLLNLPVGEQDQVTEYIY